MSQSFIKVSVKDELPKESGKYFVFAESIFSKKINRFDCRFYLHANGKHAWDCSNQVIIHWLKEK